MEGLEPERWAELRARHVRGEEQIRALVNQFRDFKDSYDDMNFTSPYLSTITARTLIVHGDRDQYFPVSIPVEMYRSIPRSCLWILPNGGHSLSSLVGGSELGKATFTETARAFLRGDWEDRP